MLVPGAVALAALVVLLGLGTWQLERKAWKEALIATPRRDFDHLGAAPREALSSSLPASQPRCERS